VHRTPSFYKTLRGTLANIDINGFNGDGPASVALFSLSDHLDLILGWLHGLCGSLPPSKEQFKFFGFYLI
jgi:hypothetical protein